MRDRGQTPGLVEAGLLYSVFWLRAFFPGLGTGAVGAGGGLAAPAWHFAILLNLVPAGLLILWMMRRGEGFAAFGLRWRPRRVEIAGVLAVLALLLFAGFLPDALLRLFAGKAPLPSWLDNPLLDMVAKPSTSGYLLIPIILASSLVTGYVEELYFRVYLSFRLERVGFGKAARVVLTSLIFGLSHGASQGIAAAFIATLLGLILALRWETAKSWHEIGFGHGLYDFVVIMALLYS
ncbi:MAG TPA: CPBP family intramembrane glutamic endopeptidase [Rectinemataceae bacterium]|nr:CPBP family intramembrane glutamic endopeptidase [Rectinemataceae bacterium]